MPAPMTPRQRLLAALRREPVDTVPISPRISAYLVTEKLTALEAAAKFDFDPYREYRCLSEPLSDPYCQRLALGDAQVEIATAREGAKTTLRRTFRTPAGPLCDVLVQPDAGPVYGPSPNPEWTEPLVKSREDAARLRYLLPDPAAADIAGWRRCEGEWGERGLVIARPTNGADMVAITALEVGRAMLLLHDDPALFDEALRVADDWHIAVMKRVLEGGARVIFDSFFHLSLSTGWSPDFYRERVAPLVRRHADLVQAYDGIYVFYDDGKIMRSIDMIASAGIDAMQTITPPPVGDADFRDLKRRYGDRICFWGGVDLIRMKLGTPAEVERMTRAALDALAPGGGYILGTSDSIREGTPAENIRAFCRTGREWKAGGEA